ncbi:MAG: hypothetical protein EPO07_08155, partial [Verrucomicrobia bacterium]
GTTLAAGGYLVIWCDGAVAATTNSPGPHNSGFALNGGSGDVYLFNSLGQPVDSVGYGVQVKNLSIGRSNGAWQLLASPTPGATNAAPAALALPPGLRVNEWMPAPLTGDDWFELYNTNTQPVDLSGLFLTDDPSVTGLAISPVPPLSFIGARSWAEFLADGHPSHGRDHVHFSLDASGETLRIYDTNRVLLDVVDFGIQSTDVSSGRLPDGADNFVEFPGSATPDSTNTLSAPPTFTLQPQSRNAYTGEAVSLTVKATGTPPLSYQWLSNNVAVAGQIFTNLTLSPVLLAHAANYRVLVTNSVGSTISDIAALTVTVPPTGSAALLNPATVKLSFPVQANRTYQVQYKTSLTTGSWLSLGSPTFVSSNLFLVNDVITGQSQRFYRLAILP